MPQDTTEHALTPVPPQGWLAVVRRRARPLARWIGQGWTAAKPSRSARRPAWE